LGATADDTGGSCAVEAIGVSVVRSRMPVLRDVSLRVEPGISLAVMGANGAGKSTLLKCLAGAVRPTEGEVRWFDVPAPRSAVLRRKIGLAGHECGVYADLSACENLVFAGRMHGIERPADRARELLTAAELDREAHRPTRQLSQGARQRLSIVRALVHDPQLIVLDEPFVSLDANARQWLERLFDQWRCTHRTVCFASHDARQSHVLADRILWLDRGRIDAIESSDCPPKVSIQSA
jgi:heme ABC exporter ATP-binding subunit CcmA